MSFGESRRGSSLLALSWTAAAMVTLRLLVAGLSLRGGALDLVSLGAAEALAYTGVTYLLLHVHERGTPLRAALGLRPTHPGLALVGVGLGASLKLPAESLTQLVERHFPPSTADLVARGALYRTSSLADVFSLSLVVCLVAPLVEELFFRGALYGRLAKAGALAAGLATGVGFVVVHADPRHWPALLMVALVLSYLRALSGSLLPCLGLHVCFNTAGVLALVTGATAPTRPLQLGPLALALSWFATALLVVLCTKLGDNPAAVRARAEDRT